MQVDLYNGHKMVVVAVVQNKTAIKKFKVDLYNGHKMVVVAVVQNKTAIKKLQ